jgi:hypothetical protein
MGEYQIYTRLEAINALPRDPKQRMMIFKFFDLLSRMPHTPGDFKEKDITLREHEVKVVGNFAVTYWFDAPVKIVMIVNLRPAGS